MKGIFLFVLKQRCLLYLGDRSLIYAMNAAPTKFITTFVCICATVVDRVELMDACCEWGHGFSAV